MKTLDISFDKSKVKFNETDIKYLETMGYGGMFELLFTQGLSSLHSNGIPVTKGIILSRIQRKLDSASESLELEESEFDLVKEAFGHNAKFAASQYRLVSHYISKIEEATKKASTEKELA